MDMQTRSRVRPPAVAGMFYPATARELAQTVDAALDAAGKPDLAHAPKAVIAPHAGYKYSGAIAASAYRAFDDVRASVRRVVIVGPSHRVALDGIALSEAEQFETPLGLVRVDEAARVALAHHDHVVVGDAAHAAEHSIEVQIPFVQRSFPGASIVPLAVGSATPEMVADALDAVWGGEETVIVISSDLSHYHDYDTATRLDGKVAESIVDGDYRAFGSRDACGAGGVRGLLRLIADGDHEIVCLDLRNSGDTAGDRQRVVGYGAFAVV